MYYVNINAIIIYNKDMKNTCGIKSFKNTVAALQSEKPKTNQGLSAAELQSASVHAIRFKFSSRCRAGLPFTLPVRVCPDFFGKLYAPIESIDSAFGGHPFAGKFVLGFYHTIFFPHRRCFISAICR